MKILRKELQRGLACILAATVMLSAVLTNFPSFNAFAVNKYTPGMTMLSGSKDWKFLCIDSYELLHEAGGVQGTNEWYAYVVPSTRLSSKEVAILFWATLTLRASKGDSIEYTTVLEKINAIAPTQGLNPITPVTEADMKTIIHLKSTQNKYPWLKAVLANEEKYMEMAGLLGGSGTTATSGKAIPTVLQNHKDLSSALVVDSGTFTIPFDDSGADKDFIQKVPLEFSADGGEPWGANPIGDWTYQKTDTSIIFSNPNPQPPKIMIRFNTDGTEYQKRNGYASVQDAYDKALQLWVCIECNDRHIYHSQKKLPLEAHQRLIYLFLEATPETYYASIAGNPTTEGITGGEIPFVVYRHEEDMTATYNLQLYKHDYETGKPLENSVFKLYERFDDKNEINTEKDGPAHIYEGGVPYKSYHTDNPVTWDGFRFISGLSTDKNGYASKTINRGYHYDKTFCDGHPAPTFIGVPDEESDEETGEAMNEDTISQAQGENKRLANDWLTTFDSCEDHATGDFEGVHFHWLMPEVDMGEIEHILSTGGSPGETPDAGKKTSASGEEAYQSSGCQEDCRLTYSKFISLRYSYALLESKARDGYTLHGNHSDDLPIEVITTDASENGANATFANQYGKDITTNDAIKFALADETLTVRKEIAAYQLAPQAFQKPEEIRLKKARRNYHQEIVRFLKQGTATASNAGTEWDAEWNDEIELIDDITENPATPSNMPAAATPSNSQLATASNASRTQVKFTRDWGADSTFRPVSDDGDDGSASGNPIFMEAYNQALNGPSYGPAITPGPDNSFSHCDNIDGEKEAWRIYDHRTEGEIHINKRDMNLEDGETGDYDSYGDTQGDGTLEGAVYGLFAAADIIHPDGQTGTVYRANNLIAVAATDKEGNASFMANTEAPGYYYSYESGKIIRTDDGWADAAPKNLYVDDNTCDDYTPDGQYERTYADNEGKNGNCWIGRPLIMGNYYIKELTRSEGYELSIGNRDNALTNKGQDYHMTVPTGKGYAGVSKGLYAEGQISANPTGEYGNPDMNELFFTAESRGTGTDGFDIHFSNLPAGARLFRLDTGSEMRESETGTGIFDKVYLTNEDGSPKYLIAENDYQYPKYNPDGSLMTVESSAVYKAGRMLAMAGKPLNPARIKNTMEAPEPAMTKEQIAAKLATDFTLADKEFLKGKVERALRANGKSTPCTMLNGTLHYSSIYAGIYDTGVRKGEQDDYGISGVAPGEPAARTVYGAPAITLEIPAVDGSGTPLKLGDAILTVLDYYNSNSFYSYGGIDDIIADGDRYFVTVYASCNGMPSNFIVLGSDPVDDSIIYHRIPYLPDDSREAPRYIYATYSNNPDYDAFGTYDDYGDEIIGGTYFAFATLFTDAVANGDGSLNSKTIKKNLYYKTGEIPHDQSGRLMQAFQYQEQTVTTTREVETYTWTEVKSPADIHLPDGNTVVHIDSEYTDKYGISRNDATLQIYSLRVLLPQKEITLTQEDLEAMPSQSGWSAGEKMGSAAYYLNVKRTKATAYLNYAHLSIAEDSSFVKRAELVYPGQEYVMQDGENSPGSNTRTTPISVQERVIRQKIKITKKIDKESYNDGNTYSEVHEDWFTRMVGSKGKETEAIDNFRFKVYLKSNLKRLYRNEDGQVIWLDRYGNETDIQSYQSAFPETVQKIYTKVPHTPDIKKNSEETVIANQELYSDSDGMIHDAQNSGYTSVLETTDQETRDEAGIPRTVQALNYPKFFDGIRTANMDRWDNPHSRDREFSTWEEWNAVRNPWNGIVDPSVKDTSYKPFARILAGVFSLSDDTKRLHPAVHDGTETQNEKNTSEKAKANARSSDAVRQFAITWYLDGEVRKLVKATANGEMESSGGSPVYPDEIYDTALFEAIKKSNNYLTPFFRYDLDKIYSIEWDGEDEGGKDFDPTTLCADALQETAQTSRADVGRYYYGISAYLPYGTYVAVEQQPYNHEEGQYDFSNKHYEIDDPKEIVLPAVYEPGGEKELPGNLADRYKYQSRLTPENLAAEYHIRFNEEWASNHTDDIRAYVIRAHNTGGDFEIYKYGLDVDRLTGTAGGIPYAGWKVTQDTYDPLKDYYNDPLVYTKEKGGHPDSHYYADDRNHAPFPPQFPDYPSDEIEKYYRYASVSEHAGILDNVQLPCSRMCGGICETKLHFKDRVPVMEGEQMAYEGIYAPMLVPWTVTAPADGADYEGNTFQGYADRGFLNRFYKTKLRIEKLDSETGESILHDQAIFAIYAAERDDSEMGEGRVKFYDKPTLISGSREFLEAMGAVDLYTHARGIIDPNMALGARWYGTVPAGTPVCKESEQIVLLDEAGNKTGEFHAFSTMRDGDMSPEPSETTTAAEKMTATTQAAAATITADQNTGYLELLQPIGAGVYVLAEIKPPTGYARSKPIAVEIYSDQVTYYLDGDRDNRVAAAVYEDQTAGRPDTTDQARIYVGNTPVRLEVSKKKTDGKTVTYRLSGRVEGSITDLKGRYGLENLELAHNASGAYLGYGWHKGTIEILAARKDAGEATGETVEIFYEKGVFSGYADITRPLLTADDTNRYVAGATLTLYDAIPVTKNADSQDYAFDGIKVERDRNSNITRMYVQQGYAGTKTEFICRKDDTGSDMGSRKKGIWTYQTVQRPDTDILFYDMGNLTVLSRDSSGNLWSYDKEGKPMRIINGVTQSIYALQKNQPVYEIVSRDFSRLLYDPMAKAFRKTSPDTVIYHLDAKGQRDSMVDSYTGMAYVLAPDIDTERRERLDKWNLDKGKPGNQNPGNRKPDKVMVWPVTVIKDRDGSILARNKIKTSRIASIHADTAQEYISGTYNSANGGYFEKWLNPVLDKHGQVEYYQRSEETYTKSWPVYDRDGDFIYDHYSDSLEQYNLDSYIIKEDDMVYDKGNLWDKEDNRNETLYMRQGDYYIMENTWISGDRTPNDPFDSDPSVGQADMLKRVAPGTYILEEVKPPQGYAKAFPTGLTVNESAQIQQVHISDETIKVEIAKLDAPDDYRQRSLDHDGIRTTKETLEKTRSQTAHKGAYTYLPVEGAKLALYRARKVYTSDTASFPDGWYLVKTETQPASWMGQNDKNEPKLITATWTSTKTPLYIEGIPAGDYILEELDAPPGYVRTTLYLDVKETGEVQTFRVGNDHTKLEIFKYQTIDGEKKAMPNVHAAQLSLYPAVTDEDGNPMEEDGTLLYKEDHPVDIWMTDDCRQYTTLTDVTLYQKGGIWSRIKSLLGAGRARYSGFEHDYEAMYREYGTGFKELHWYYTDIPYEGRGELPGLREGIVHLKESYEADTSGCVTQLWEQKDGRIIRITVSPNQNPLTGDALTFEYQYHYKKLENNMVSYDTPDGFHRIDYIPWNGGTTRSPVAATAALKTAYVLVETKTPDGYQTAEPKLIIINETTDIQMYAMENRPNPPEPENPPETTVPEETTPSETPETTVPSTIPEESESTPPQTVPETPSIPETDYPGRPDRPNDNGEPPTIAETTTLTAPDTAEETRIGRITARYGDGRQTGKGYQKWHRKYLSKTGDRFLMWLWISLLAVSGVGILVLTRRREDEKKTKNRSIKQRGSFAFRADKDHATGHVDPGDTGSDEHRKMPGGKGRNGSGKSIGNDGPF